MSKETRRMGADPLDRLKGPGGPGAGKDKAAEELAADRLDSLLNPCLLDPGEVLDSAPVAVCAWGKDGRIVYANQAFLDLSGHKPEEAAWLTWNKSLFEDPAGAPLSLGGAGTEGHALRVWQLRRRDGLRLRVEAAVHAAASPAKAAHFAFVRHAYDPGRDRVRSPAPDTLDAYERLVMEAVPFPDPDPSRPGRKGASVDVQRLREVYLALVLEHKKAFSRTCTDKDLAAALALILIRLESVFGLECGRLALSRLEAPATLEGGTALDAASGFMAVTSAVCALNPRKPACLAFDVAIANGPRGGTILTMGGCGGLVGKLKPDPDKGGLFGMYAGLLAAKGGMVLVDTSRDSLVRISLPAKD